MATRQLKFTGNVGTTAPTGEILINEELVYSGTLGAAQEVSPASGQPADPPELIIVSYEGNDTATETVSVTINVTEGVVRVGPIWSDRIDAETGEATWIREFSEEYGDGRADVTVNGETLVAGPTTGDWHGWCFSVSTDGAFSCNCVVNPKIPFVPPEV